MGSLTMLYYAGYDHSDRTAAIPSFVLDWSTSTMPRMPQRLKKDDMASKQTKPQFSFNELKSELQLKGVTVDTIKLAVRPTNPVEFGRSLSAVWKDASWYQHCLVRDLLNIQTIRKWFEHADVRQDRTDQDYAAFVDLLDQAPESYFDLASWVEILLDRVDCCPTPSRLHVDSDPYHLLGATKVHASNDPNDNTVLSTAERYELDRRIARIYDKDLMTAENGISYLPNIMDFLIKMPDFRMYIHLRKHGLLYPKMRLTTCHPDCQLVQTEHLRLGQGPGGCMPGDVVALIAGLSIPMVLRRHGSSFLLIGPMYLAGAMHGELWPDDPMKLVDILLV
jgi:predicted nucleic acid-binding protein